MQKRKWQISNLCFISIISSDKEDNYMCEYWLRDVKEWAIHTSYCWQCFGGREGVGLVWKIHNSFKPSFLVNRRIMIKSGSFLENPNINSISIHGRRSRVSYFWLANLTLLPHFPFISFTVYLPPVLFSPLLCRIKWYFIS